MKTGNVQRDGGARGGGVGGGDRGFKPKTLYCGEYFLEQCNKQFIIMVSGYQRLQVALHCRNPN